MAGGRDDEAAIGSRTSKVLDELGCLPGVVVQGHRWLFVFSTPEFRLERVDEGKDRHRTAFWTELEFGSTRTILGSYQIVAGLRRLAKWANTVYVPWYTRHVLSGPAS